MQSANLPVETMQNRYEAPRPTRSSVLFRNPWLRLIFPPLLLWDAASSIANRLFGASIGEKVLSSQKQNFAKQYAGILLNTIKHVNEKEDTLSATRLTVKTHDGAELDTLQIKQKHQTAATQTIIHFVGSGMCYEQIMNDMILESKDLKCDSIAFNFRGVSQSAGQATAKSQLVIDGIAQVQRLIDNGTDPQKIILKGHSLGASIATLVAKHFYDQGITINLFNGRSFSTLTNHWVGQIRAAATKTGHSETPTQILIGTLRKPFIKLYLLLTQWEIDAASAYRNLPEAHKEYCVVRSNKSLRAAHGNKLKDDPIVTHYASLHKAMKHERTKSKTKGSTKKVAAKDPTTNAHQVRLAELNTRQGATANDFFKSFYHRVAENRAKEAKKTPTEPQKIKPV